jgi:hypothetical protein
VESGVDRASTLSAVRIHGKRQVVSRQQIINAGIAYLVGQRLKREIEVVFHSHIGEPIRFSEKVPYTMEVL